MELLYQDHCSPKKAKVNQPSLAQVTLRFSQDKVVCEDSRCYTYAEARGETNDSFAPCDLSNNNSYRSNKTNYSLLLAFALEVACTKMLQGPDPVTEDLTCIREHRQQLLPAECLKRCKITEQQLVNLDG